MSPVLTIVAQGGLCNRLRVVLSALFFSRHTERNVTVAWAKNAECFARFEDLFYPLKTANFGVVGMSWWLTPVSRYNLHLPALLRWAFFDVQQKNFHPKVHGALQQLTSEQQRIYLSTGYALCDYPASSLSQLKPLEEVQRRIDALTAMFTAYTVGVHIRRTDNVCAIQSSPTEMFIEAMQAEVECHPQVRFFLATDDICVRELLQTHFPDRIIFQPMETCRRDTLEGMRQAVVDLFCLAKTQKLLGSYWSSFTDTAAEIGGMPLTIVKADGATQ